MGGNSASYVASYVANSGSWGAAVGVAGVNRRALMVAGPARAVRGGGRALMAAGLARAMGVGGRPLGSRQQQRDSRGVAGGFARQQSGGRRDAPGHRGGKQSPMVQSALWREKYST